MEMRRVQLMETLCFQIYDSWLTLTLLKFPYSIRTVWCFSQFCFYHTVYRKSQGDSGLQEYNVCVCYQMCYVSLDVRSCCFKFLREVKYDRYRYISCQIFLSFSKEISNLEIRKLESCSSDQVSACLYRVVQQDSNAWGESLWIQANIIKSVLGIIIFRWEIIMFDYLVKRAHIPLL